MLPGENTDPTYENLSRVFRSNIFPTVPRKCTSSAQSTYIDHRLDGAPNKQNFRHKDWLGKWNERDAHRLNVLRGSDEKYQERMKRVRHSIDLPSITRQAKAANKKQSNKSASATSLLRRSKQTTGKQLPSLNVPRKPSQEQQSVKTNKEGALKLPLIETAAVSVTGSAEDENERENSSPTKTEESLDGKNNSLTQEINTNQFSVAENEEDIIETEVHEQSDSIIPVEKEIPIEDIQFEDNNKNFDKEEEGYEQEEITTEINEIQDVVMETSE